MAVVLLQAAWSVTSAALGAETNVNCTVELPPLLRPVTLRDCDGNAETGLVDPFRRRGEDESASSGQGEDGLMRTTMGEISSEFKILAISIPTDTNTPRSALIQFYTANDPVLIHEGDLVRVDRVGGGRGMVRKAVRRAVRVARASAAAGRRRAGASDDAELEEQLRKFVFYVNVKHIEPTYIEVYHNKKRPDETIRLNW